jgi:DNA end-binding protein Ku
MARAIWSGSINFGLVSIPVAMYSATEDHTVHFHQFQRGTADRIRYQRINERTGKEVDYSDIVKGADVVGETTSSWIRRSWTPSPPVDRALSTSTGS